MILKKWTSIALDIDEAMKLPVGVNIRQLKAGIKLASCLCRIDEQISAEFLVIFQFVTISVNDFVDFNVSVATCSYVQCSYC